MHYKQYKLDSDGEMGVQGHEVNPQTGVVEVTDDQDFVYLVRTDGPVTAPIAENISRRLDRNERDTRVLFAEQYDKFTTRLMEELLRGYEHRGTPEIHLYDWKEIEDATRERVGASDVISLDPLYKEGATSLRLSRGYYTGGLKSFGQVPKPQELNTADQLGGLSASGERRASIVEDDIFTGGSIGRIVDLLRDTGIEIDKVVPGIQVGSQKTLQKKGIMLDPVVSYEFDQATSQKTADQPEAIYDRVDLGDPRDFCIGLSGLVVRLPNGDLGRAPYLLPFVSPHARATIPADQEREFSQRILQLNYDFWSGIDQKLGRKVMLRDMDPAFVAFINGFYNIDTNTGMADLCQFFAENMDELWEKTRNIGQREQQLDEMGIGKDVVFIDVNGTMISSDAKDTNLPPEQVARFQELVQQLAEKGVQVGLNSDSPLAMLQRFAAQVGLENGPILAENGMLLVKGNKKMVLGSVDPQTLQERITKFATDLGFKRVDNVIAVEFGGHQPDFQKGEWGFGYGREATLSVFAPPELITALGENMSSSTGITMDVSPQYNFFAAHPGTSYRENKGKTLDMLRQFGRRVSMIGDSKSDFVPPQTGVDCYFVSNHSLPADYQSRVRGIAQRPELAGTNEILESILSQYAS